MKTTWLGLFLCLLTFSLKAQDYLTPAADYFSTSSYRNAYYNLIRSKLLVYLNDRPLARVIVRPSFTPEYIVTVDTLNRTNYLIYRTSKTSLWSIRNDTARAHREPIQEYRKRISPELAQALTDLFFDTISQAHYPPIVYGEFPNGQRGRAVSIRLDGITYSFASAAHSPEGRGGETHSPAPGTLMAELVAVTDRMIALAKNEPQETEQTLQRAAEVLYKKIVKP